LSQIVGAEAKELRNFRDLIGQQRSARNFDHGTDQVIHLGTARLDDRVGDLPRLLFQDLQLSAVEHQGMHDLG
jgi:hypothetical protein